MTDGQPLRLQLRIGAFVVVSLGVLLAVIYLLGAQARFFERKYDLYARFGEVGGLIEGATVRLAGVQIGRVTEVSLPPEPGGRVRVTLSISRRFSDRIRKDSQARIVTQGLLGDRLVEITIGDPAQPPLQPGETIASQEPFEMGRMVAEGAETLASINRLAETLRAAVEALDRGGALDDLAAAVRSGRRVAEQLETLGRDGAYADLAAAVRSGRRVAEQLETLGRDGAYADLAATMGTVRRLTERVEKGGGWLHALIYEEPAALRRLDALLGSAQAALGRATDGDSAVAVLLSPQSGRAARSLLAAMEALGRGAERGGGEEGLASALLFDPRYRSVAEDVRVVARNFREVSERLHRGQGLLGGLLTEQADGPMGQAAADFRVAMANLRAVTERLRAGEGTIGGLLEDPAVYENLAAFLEGAQRSWLLRTLIRSTISGGASGAGRAGGADPGR